MRSWARRSAVAALAGALLLAACASGRSAHETVGGWVDRVRGETTAEGPARVSYAAGARTRIYREPDASSPVIGVLDRYEELQRYQSVSGFAFVRAQGDLSGWVSESQLVARRPQARKPAATPPSEASPGQPAEPPAPPDSAETEAPPPDAEAPSEAAPPDSGAEPLEPERSVFDPY